MADNKNMVRFGRGTKSLEDFQLITGYENMVYFNTEKHEIYVGDNSYGFSEDDRALLGNGGIKKVEYTVKSVTPEGSEKAVDYGYVVITFNNDQTAEVCIPNSDRVAPGLMTAEQVSALNTVAGHVLTLIGTGEGSVAKAKADAISHADGLVNALNLSEVSASGKAIVKVSQSNGQVSAETGVISSEYVSTEVEGYEGKTVKAVFGEMAAEIVALEGKADNVAGSISGAIEALDSEKEGTSAHVNVKVTQVDGKIDSVVVTNDDIASEAALNTLSESVGAAGDAAKADGSVYARIAALVAADGVLSGRLDALEGEDGAVADALAEAKEYADGLVAGLDANVSSAEGQKLTVNVVEVDGVITEVNVTDHDIASAESLKSLTEKVDAFLDAEGLADKTLDTLKEIQDFINSEAGAADEMLLAIGENKAAIEKEVKDREDAIKGLNSEEASENGSFVNVTVKQEAGVITSVSVSETNIASAAELDALEALVGTAADGKEAATAFGKIAAEADARESAVNTINGRIDSVEDAVEDAQANAEKYADDAVKALKEGEVAANAAAIAKEIEDRQAGDEATLASANAYTDNALMWIED